MSSDYLALRTENERRYGTDIGRIGQMLLADRYDDRTHFIFELIQNAEDALRRCETAPRSRKISFTLTEKELEVAHFGRPFDLADVRGVCGIAESTKSDLTAIGRFGIGFKSVYAFTDRPEIHSGAEHFAIDDFVKPVEVVTRRQRTDETRIVLPLRNPDDHEVISAGLQRLGADTLLFLRQVLQIEWNVLGSVSGFYIRDPATTLAPGVRRIVLMGQAGDGSQAEEEWLVFERQVSHEGHPRGVVEIAFCMTRDDETGDSVVQVLESSTLVAYFPTVLETNLGFRIQGPYRTTPSRDNIPRSDPWNRHLLAETALLLIEALKWMREEGILGAQVLKGLPIHRAQSEEASIVRPLFVAVRDALRSEPLLPRHGEGYVAASSAKLARTREVRELLDDESLTALLGEAQEASWLSGDITQDRTPELRQYLMRELQVGEVTPETLVTSLSRGFLESRSDEWMCRLYEFLGAQQTLLKQGRLEAVPLIRLRDGQHVRPPSKAARTAFLPGSALTDFPTVREEVCSTGPARSFLVALGVTEPSLVDDVISNVLPRYGAGVTSISPDQYQSDLSRILGAFQTDSTAQKERLVAALRAAKFVAGIEQASKVTVYSLPADVYLPGERLRLLLADVPGAVLIDDQQEHLAGEGIRRLLEACGGQQYLRTLQKQPTFTAVEKSRIRREAGHEHSSGQKDALSDWTLPDLEPILSIIQKQTGEAGATRSKALWEALLDVAHRRGQSFFTGLYTWTDYGSYRAQFPAEFVRRLNEAEWLPGRDGQLHAASEISFEDLGWQADPFLQSMIHFRPPAIEMLAREVGIESGVLDLLKRLGLTSEAELRAKLQLAADVRPSPEIASATPGAVPGGSFPSDAVPEGNTFRGGSTPSGRHEEQNGSGIGAASTPHAAAHQFVSYVAVHADEEVSAGANSEELLALEEQAIELILREEPELKRAPPQNPGYDLYALNGSGLPARWIEVKAMSGSLRDRPVGLSARQFAEATRLGEAFCLYVVECAGLPSARVLRIANPAGRARTFTFDSGWLDIAVTGRLE